jgi:hypothetical protein
LKHVNVTQWVRGNSSPTRPQASHPVGSRTEVRSRKRGVRSTEKHWGRSQQLTIHTKLPTSRFDENPLRSSIILQQTKTPKPVASGSLRVLDHRN